MNLSREPQPLLNLNFSLCPPSPPRPSQLLSGHFCDVVKQRNLQCLLSLPLCSPPIFSFSSFTLLQLPRPSIPLPGHRGESCAAHPDSLPTSR